MSKNLQLFQKYLIQKFLLPHLKNQSLKKQKTVQLHSKPRPERKLTYFCRLYRKYNISERKAHLKNYHRADPDTISKRATKDIVDVIFQESI